MATSVISLFRRSTSLLFALLTWLLVAPAQAQDSTLTRLIRQNQYALAPNGAQFSGAGWDKIQVSIQKSQYVLLGESHGTAQVPQFAAAVAQVLKPAVYVAEVDPYAAQTLTQLAAQPGLPTAYLRQYPDALAFANWGEEFDLIRTLRAQQTRLVGLDQLFIAAAAPFYAQLAGEVKSKAARAYLQRRATAYQAHAQADARLGKDDYTMGTQRPATVDSLVALAKGESPTVQKMVADYQLSYRIYQGQIAGTGGHQERLNLMKRKLLQEFRAYQPYTAQPTPKMLFKFGSVHLARGLSPLAGEYYDIGNLMQNLADAHDQQSLHLYVTGKQGTAAHASNPNFPAKNTHMYTATDNKNIRLFLDQVAGPAWAVFDLRPIRRALLTGKVQVTGQSLQRIIQGYDYLVIIPETTASRVL